jgi:hypothetical protein
VQFLDLSHLFDGKRHNVVGYHMVIVTEQNKIVDLPTFLVLFDLEQSATAWFGGTDVVQLSNVRSIFHDDRVRASRERTLIAQPQIETSYGFRGKKDGEL